MITDLSRWTPRPPLTNAEMAGRYAAIVPFDRAVHEDGLWTAFGDKKTNALLYHFGWPRLESAADLGAVIADLNAHGGFVTCVFTQPETGAVMGMASYMRIDEKNGVCEVGAVAHGTPMARSPVATEVHYLMARRVFDELGYRRYEWKLNNPNAPSHRAARRLGFTFEGVFRQHEVKPYGNRDTAWYSMLDREWPVAREAMERWLDPANFDADGNQKRRLEQIRSDVHARQA